MSVELLILRLIHVLGGVFWVGSGLFTTFFLLPALANTGVAAGQIVNNLQRRKYFLLLPTVAVITMLSGIRLMSLTGGVSRYMQTTSGRAYALSGLASLVAFFVSILVSRPMSARAARLSQAAASDEMSRARLADEIRALQRRATLSSRIAVALLVFAAAGMAIARYL